MKNFFSLHRIAVVLAFLFFSKNSSAKNFYPTAIIPGVSVGYIFGAGISLGTELNYTPFVFKSGLGKTAMGLYAGLNYFYSKGEIYKETWYHTFTAGAIAFSDQHFMFKAGGARTVLRWGRDGMNKKISKHRSIDIDMSYSPWGNGVYVGYRLYFPGDACFGLDIDTVHMLYSAYRYNFNQALFKSSKE